MGDGGLREDLVQTSGRGPGPGQAGELAHQDADPGREDRVPGGGEDLTHGHPVPGQQHSGHGDHTELEQRGHGDGLARGPALHPPHAVTGLGQLGQRAQDAGRLPVLRARRPDGAVSADGLREGLRDPALHLLVARHALPGVPAEGPQQQGEHRRSGQEHGREPGGDEAEGHDGTDRSGERGEQGGAGGRRRAGLCGVADEARDEVSGPEAGGGARPDGQDMPGEAAAQPGGGAGVEGAAEDGLHRVQQGD